MLFTQQQGFDLIKPSMSWNNSWPTIFRYFSPEFFYQFFIGRFFERSCVQEDGTLVSPPCIVDKRLCAIDSSSEVVGRSHPMRRKLYTISWTDHHAKRWVRPLYPDGVWWRFEFKRVVCRFFLTFVFFRILSKPETSNADRFHDVLGDKIWVAHTRDLLYHSAQEEVAYIWVVVLASWSLF